MLHKVSWVWVAPPLATSLVVLAHPIIDPWHDGVAGLAPLVARNDVWLAVHLALLVLFPLSALALIQAVSGIESAGARLARLMLPIFAVLYAGFDTFAGLATGTIVRSARELGAAEQSGVLLAVKGLFNSPITGVLFVFGTAAWTLGAGAVAFTLWMASAPLAPVGLIAIAALLLFLDHPAPFGPVTFAAVAAALAWLAWRGPSKD
ncbi:MAG TPA: hypothetical protein VFS98_00030 [Methylomirabilota bacterium]|nr:hypothetical protein [Methylomirabilota bacterium]